eukprot:1064536_1
MGCIWFWFDINGRNICYFSSLNGIEERTLGTHTAGSLIPDNSWVGNVQTEMDNGQMIIKIIRPFAALDTYDFTSFMEATTSSMSIISAIGNDMNFTQHDMDSSASGTIRTSCSVVDSTPSPVTPVTRKPCACSNANIVKPSLVFLVTAV